MAKRALVTGACGFTGTNMLEHLDEKGWEIVATDLRGAERKAYYTEVGEVHPVHYEDILDELEVEFIPADLVKKETLEPLFEYDYDAVFHIASLYDYFAEWDELYKVNVEGAKNIGEIAAEANVGHFVHWSTEGVLQEAGPDEPVTEDAPYHAHNLYSKSKIEQEKVLWKLYEEEGLPLTVIRPAPVYGPRHRYGEYHILLLLNHLGEGFVPRVYPRSRQLMYPSVHVKDVVRAAVFLNEKKEESIGEAYNVLSDCLPQDEMMEFLARALGLEKITRVPVPWPIYRFFGWLAGKLGDYFEGRARRKGARPKVDASMTQYVSHNFWFSNQKIKDLGFEFVYEDPRKGLWDYITWCKEKGWL